MSDLSHLIEKTTFFVELKRLKYFFFVGNFIKIHQLDNGNAGNSPHLTLKKFFFELIS
jgi:hypothetical protein